MVSASLLFRANTTLLFGAITNLPVNAEKGGRKEEKEKHSGRIVLKPPSRSFFTFYPPPPDVG
jgi:hypothetical protein